MPNIGGGSSFNRGAVNRGGINRGSINRGGTGSPIFNRGNTGNAITNRGALNRGGVNRGGIGSPSFNRGNLGNAIGNRSPIFNRGNVAGARAGNLPGLNRGSALRGGNIGRGGNAIRGGGGFSGGRSIAGGRGGIGGGRNFAFNSRRSGFGGRNFGGRGGFGRGGFGFRNSWGLFLSFGYGGWGYGYGGWGFGPGLWGPGWGGWGYGGWGLGLGYPGGWGGYGYGGYGGYDPYFDFAYAPPAVDGYYNPYCGAVGVAGVQPAFDYTQPIVGQGTPTEAGVSNMTAADEAFHRGDYKTALAEADKAAKAMPNNANVHQFRSLALFALGQYRESAAAAHAALAGGPGWNWQTLRSFYSTKEEYTSHLRALESYRADSSEDLPSRFLLGYHYMMLGHSDAAAAEFVALLEAEPRDKLTAQLLAAISKKNGKQYKTPVAPDSQPPAGAKLAGPKLPPAPPLPTEALRPGQRPGPTTKAPGFNMAGTWTSTAPDGTTFTLSVVEGGKFKWTAKNGEKVLTIEGQLSVQNDALQLKPTKGDNTLEGKLTVKGNNEFQFKPKFAPADEPGLTFKRQ